MRMFYRLNVDDYASLLAANKTDVAEDGLGLGLSKVQIPVDKHNRTIFIGLGGTGVKTINHIKRVISQRLAGWEQFVAFLAVDADRRELTQANQLSDEEFVNITQKGIEGIVKAGKDSYPRAWNSFVDEEKAKNMADYGGDGSGRRRLMGKMKIHSAVGQANGVDETIMDKLRAVKANVLAPLNGNSTYQVYVIGSLNGGTGSGGFTEMPALIRTALNAGSAVKVNAMLYLPDTLSGLFTDTAKEMMANGYASLKELNYYQGMQMRTGCSETWLRNNAAQDQITLTSDDGFYDMPYLIGTISGAMKDSDTIARQTIAEYFISLLGDMNAVGGSSGQNMHMVDSFVNNAMQHKTDRAKNPNYPNGEVEAVGSAHEFPRCYATLGYAQASAPKKIIYAYAVGEGCRKAGLIPVSNDDRVTMQANGQVLPFLGEDQLMTVQVVNGKRAELLAPVLQLVEGVTDGALFSYRKERGGDIKASDLWKEINDGTAEGSEISRKVDKAVEDGTNETARKKIKEELAKQLQTFKDAVKLYVTEHGPMAFYNLYHGNAARLDSDPATLGIKEALERLVDRLDVESGEPRVWPAETDLKKKKDTLAQNIAKGIGLIDIPLGKLGWGDKRATKAEEWVRAYNRWANCRINEKRRDMMLGRNGLVYTEFLLPVAILAEELYAFGKILEVMAKGYINSGSNLNTLNAFRNVRDNATEVNIGALNSTAHAWIWQAAQTNAQNVAGAKVRKSLVDSFFANPGEWMAVEDSQVMELRDGHLALQDEDRPVKARELFDRCVGEHVSIAALNLSVENLFTQVAAASNNTVSYDVYAGQIVSELFARSQPLFDTNKAFDGADIHRYLMYPSSLAANQPAVVNALRKAVENLPGDVGFYSSAFADSISMYQMVAPFEVYRLKELGTWEKEYEARLDIAGNGLHGKSPDVKKGQDAQGMVDYVEGTGWDEYPAITYQENPQTPDSNGFISREGQVRNKLDKIIDEAKAMGLLYCQADASGKYLVYRVRLDNSRAWNFNPMLLRADPKTKLLPSGAEMLNAVATQNGVSMQSITAPVILAGSGLMTSPHDTEDNAWKYAKRVLYAHRPMLNQIRDTLAKVRPWHEKIQEMNKAVLAKMKPAKMLRIMMSGRLYADEGQMWCLIDENEMELPVANLSKEAMEYMEFLDPRGFRVLSNGFTLFYVYQELLKQVDGERLDACLDKAKATINAKKDPQALIAASKLAVSLMDKERALLTEFGANLEDPSAPFTQAFKKKMDGLDLGQDAEALVDFYARLPLWKFV